VKKDLNRRASRSALVPGAIDVLRRKSLKLTGPRRAILNLLEGGKHPLTVREIHSGLSRGDSNLVTVYRSLHLLEAMGLVKRYDFGDGIARFELLNEGDDGHHHHLICRGCRRVVEIDDCFPREVEEAIAAKNCFKAVTHKLEFFGLCPACQGPKN
jgi:Fur family ferric uptake transcriptional regulator